MALLKVLENPRPDEIGSSVEEFLYLLGEPSCIVLDGKDNSRTRAVVTLLHGNEPSGAMAIFRWIKSEKTPEVRIICILASVTTALYPPLFHYRVLPGSRDLNRCFQPPYEDEAGELAESILHTLECYEPEAVVDIHNTSGSGPAFGVATHHAANHSALVSLFTNKLMITHLNLGALMDISGTPYSTMTIPTVTIEAGGRLDKEAHDSAWSGLVRFFCEDQVLTRPENTKPLDIFMEPVRIELKQGVSLSYAKTPNTEFDVTLLENIEYLNFKPVTQDQHLGWVNRGGLENFIVQDVSNGSTASDWLQIKNNKLYPCTDSIFFMITNNPVIAIDDCLFYGVSIKS